MADKKNITKEEIVEKLEPVSEAVKKASQTVGDLARDTAEKTAAAVKDAAKKAEPTVRAAGKSIRDTGRRAKTAGKAAASSLVPKVYVQWGENEADCATLIERAKADFRASNKGGIHSVRLYVKPEDGTAYYVINGKEGKIDL
jgi:hypothetical protein